MQTDTEQNTDDRITVIQPRPWQVVQRTDAGNCRVAVQVRCGLRKARIEARLVLMSNASGAATNWLRLEATADGELFEGTVPATAGGWYSLEVRAVDDAGAAAETSVHHVGVGEVFITAGQSNSSNYGCTPLRAEEDRVVAYDGGAWQPAVDPLPGARGEGGSPWCPFADRLVRHLDVPVAIAAVGYHGVKAAEWAPGGEAWPRLERVLKALGPNGVRAVLWHQGEADNGAGTTGEDYYAALAAAITASREAAGYRVPWFVARASFVPAKYEPPQERSAVVRGAQTRLCTDGLALPGPDTDDMTGPEYRCDDEIHMNANGLRTHGERWFRAVSVVLRGRQ